MAWEPSPDLLAQLGHAGYGALIVFVFYVFFPLARIRQIFGKRWKWLAAVIGVVGVLTWALPKEFIFDTLIERASQANNLRDLSFYLVGSGAAVLALYLKARISRRQT